MSERLPQEEREAYAVAAWSRFEDDVPDVLLRAVTGAFALVAASDGSVAREEIERFFALLRTRAKLFPGLDFDVVEDGFLDICGALLSDPAAGRARALAHIEPISQTAAHCQLVLAAAHIAAEADDRERQGEHEALQAIRNLLGVTP